MITLFISATLASQTPSAAVCASAYALELMRRQASGELPGPGADPRSLTPSQRQSAMAADNLATEGLPWSALATRTDAGTQEVNKTFSVLAKSPEQARAAFAACSAIRVASRLPEMAPPRPLVGDGEECLAEVAEMYASVRACVSLDILRQRAHATQSKLEQGALSCRSEDALRYAWVQIGVAAASADSARQRARCAAQ
jgi:hypothetical protein